MNVKLNAVVIVLLVNVLSAVGSILHAEPIKLRLPISSLSGFQAAIWIANEGGVFKKNNILAEIIYMPGGSLAVQALISGEVGLASIAPPSAITAWAKGADIAIVAGGIDLVPQVIVANPNIKSLPDIRGKRFGISRFGSLSHVSALEAFARENVEAKDVTFVQAGGLSERLAMLQNGAIDAGIFNLENLDQAQKQGAKLVLDLRNLKMSYPTQGLVASRKFLAENRAVVKSAVKSYAEGIRILKSDREFSMRVLANKLNIKDPVLSSTYDVYSSMYSFPPFVKREGVEYVLKGVSVDPARKAIVDDSIIKELFSH